MNKSSKKPKKYDAVRASVIRYLAAKHQVTEAMVRMSLSDDRQSDTAIAIRSEFPKKYKQVKDALN